MASSTLLRDLEENFFMCPVCLEQFQEPKSLPCLHRYCSNCLRTLVNASFDGTIKCPMCKQQCAIPENGIDGFKTDFHMKSVVEFIQLQKALEKKDLKDCVSCSQEKNVSAYCFKCKDFLCEECYNVHITSKMFTDHTPRTLTLDNTEGNDITLEKLATLTEDPRCRTHVEENAKLCCRTCINEPICMICTYSKHKGHDLHDVTELAKTERNLLESKLAKLQKLKSKLYELPKNVEATKQKLKENVSMKTDILINQHKQQLNKIKYKLEERRNERLQGLTDIEKRRKDEETQTNRNYEEEINKLNKKYDEIRKATERKYNNECQQFNDGCDTLESELDSKLERLDMELTRLTISKDLLNEEHARELGRISDNCDQVIERYENFTAIASSILASKDEWAQVQCIPDIRAACEPLIEGMKEEYPQLDSLSDIYISDMPKLIVGDVTIIGHEQSIVDLEGLKAMVGTISRLASSKNGNIVVSGNLSVEYSHITVIDRNGKIQRQDQIKREKEHHIPPYRYCCYLSEFKVATVCMLDEIGIYDVRDGSYNRKYISDVIRSWSADRRVLCVTNDSDHIIVGTNSRYVYLYDDQLNYICTITLPDNITGVDDITVHAGTLLVCDYGGKRAYAVSMEGSNSKLIYEFTNPYFDGSDVRPFRVCTDKNDFIYLLCRVFVTYQSTCNIVHYSQDGRQLLATRKVDKNASCLATLEVGEAEKLLVATFSSRKVYEYGITTM